MCLWASQNYSIIFKTLSSVSIKGIKLKDQDLAPDPAHLQIATEEVVGKRYAYLTDLMIWHHTVLIYLLSCICCIRSRERERDRDRYGDRDRYERRSSRDRDWERRRRERSTSPAKNDNQPAEEPPVKKRKEALDTILTRTGGAYIPPAKLRMMQAQITDKSRLVSQLEKSLIRRGWRPWSNITHKVMLIVFAHFYFVFLQLNFCVSWKEEAF